MKQRITRRTLLAAAAATRAAAAQTAAPPAIPSTPEEEVTSARASIRSNIEQLDKTALPMSTEPATQFKA